MNHVYQVYDSVDTDEGFCFRRKKNFFENVFLLGPLNETGK